MPSVRTPPRGFGISTRRTGLRLIRPSSSSFFTLGQCLEPVFELGHGHPIDARRSLVRDHSLIRQLHVLRSTTRSMSVAVLRFRSPGCRRADLGTRVRLPRQFRAGTSRRGRSCERFCFSLRIEIIRPTLGLRCSALRRCATYYGLG